MAHQTAAQAAQALQLVKDARSTNYTTLAALALLVFEYVITFEQEVRLFWASPWSLMKGVYLWNRYFSLLVVGFNAALLLQQIDSDSVCELYLKPQGAFATIIAATVDCILILRVWLLYHKSRKMLAFLVFLFIAEVTTMTAIAVFSVPTEYIHFGAALTGCYSTTIPRFFRVYVVPALGVSCIMFTLTLYRCIVTLGPFKSSAMPMIRLFLRDGISWFLAVLVMLTTDILIWSRGRPTLAELPINLSCSLYSIIGSRVLMNIRDAMEVKVIASTGVDFQLQTVTLTPDMHEPIVINRSVTCATYTDLVATETTVSFDD